MSAETIIMSVIGLLIGLIIGYVICTLCASAKISDLQDIIQEQRQELKKQRNRIIDFVAVECAPKYTDIELADPDPYTPEEQEKALSNMRQLFDQVAAQEDECHDRHES